MPMKSIAKIAAVSLSALLLAATLNAQTSDPVTISGASKVRIVRLSQVKGEAKLDRVNGHGFEPAITNLPVIEKSRIQTGAGVAEVEFEDNSSLRIGPNSMVEFPTLERLPGGTTVSSVHLVTGTAYVSLMKTPGNEFNLLFGEQSLRLPGASHVRLEVQSDEAKLAVLDGSVHIENASGVMDVQHKNNVTFRMDDSSAPKVAKAFEANQLDAWDHNAVEYHSRSAAMSAVSGSPYAYGSSDMAYYGNFANYGGCGSMWRPYFASAGWDPYGSGAMAWYQGAGYSWVSPYPWGWMPYHSGSWSYCQGTGWGWMPGGSWQGLNNMAAVTSTNGPNNPGKRPILPTTPPRAGESSLRGVNLTSLVRSEVTSDSFLFRKDSAGLGVPRGELGKLDKFSEHAIEKGTVSTRIYVEAPSQAGVRSPSANGNLAVATMHRGSPPPAAGSFSQNSIQDGRSGNSNLSGPQSSSPQSTMRSASPAPSGPSHH